MHQSSPIYTRGCLNYISLKLFILFPKMASHILFLALLALISSLAIASDPSPLQDFCVADNTSPGNLTCSLILP